MTTHRTKFSFSLSQSSLFNLLSTLQPLNIMGRRNKSNQYSFKINSAVMNFRTVKGVKSFIRTFKNEKNIGETLSKSSTETLRSVFSRFGVKIPQDTIIKIGEVRDESGDLLGRKFEAENLTISISDSIKTKNYK